MAGVISFSSAVVAQTTTSAAYKYATAITVSFPKGSAASNAKDGLPPSIKFSPCDNETATSLDQINISLKFDAGKTPTGSTTPDNRRDTFFLLFRPESKGTVADPKYMVVKKSMLGTGIVLRATTSDFDPATDYYMRGADNLGGALVDTIFGGNVAMEGIPAGLWVAVSIIAKDASPKNTLDLPFLDDPSQWAAWDALPFLVRKPWMGASASTCL